MRSETAQLWCAPGADVAAVEAALHRRLEQQPGLLRRQLQRNLEGCWGAGTHTLDLLWDAAAPALADVELFAALPGLERADRVAYTAIDGGRRGAPLRDGIWRTLLFRVRPEAGAAHVAGLERDLLRMPAYMQRMRGWRLSRVTTPGTWTHVWQQEYAELGDLLGEYLMHPYHWGWVDRWFDPEFAEWTVELPLCHGFCPLPTSVLDWQPAA